LIPAAEAEQSCGERKRLILGKASGCVEEYGHVDLMVGLRAENEVFPVILQWLTDHDTLMAQMRGS